MARLPRFILAAIILALAATAARAQPTLTINGATAANNSAVAHAKKLTPLTLQLTGTPGAPFALLLSGDAFDGVPAGEATVAQGFFLRPWKIATVIDSPIHPVFDGIGMALIRDKLNSQFGTGLAPTDVVLDTAAPLFRFNASGTFSLTFETPPTALLRNNTPIGIFTDPLVVPLESTSSFTLALFMQVLELDVQTLNLNVGNGVKVIFDPIAFSSTVGYSEGVDADLNTTIATARQTLGTIADGNLGDGSLSSLSVAADFSGSLAANIDIWRITLAGVHEGTQQSISPVGEDNVVTAPTPDNATGLQEQWKFASGLEFLTGTGPALNNENLDFPSISLPGNRRLFHWRNASLVPTGPTFGFGIYYGSSGLFRNLTPASVGTFVGDATRSAWKFEVGVTPDGNRALVVLDPSSGSNDRVFILNLQEGQNFSNGLPAAEMTPTNSTDLSTFTRVWPESISFVTTNTGNWVGFVCSSSDTSGSASQYPNRLFRIDMTDSPSIPGAGTIRVIPNTPINTASRLDRQPVVSPDNKSLALTWGTSASVENVAVVSSVTAGTHSLLDVTAFPTNTQLLETNDAHNGLGGTMRFSPDGTLLAMCRISSSANQIPMIARADSSTKGMVSDAITDITTGGAFDFVYYKKSRDYYITADNNNLMFFQGNRTSGPPSDRYDLFSVDLTSKVATNLTRTAAQKVLNGPFTADDPTNTPPTLDPSGYFLSPNKNFLYFFRDLRLSGLGNFDRFNIAAVSVKPVGIANKPTFKITNITGTEFEPLPNAGAPTAGAPDIIGDGVSLVTEGTAHYLGLRRIGGTGPFSNYAYFTARYADTAAGGKFPTRRNIDQLFLMDLNNPAPALVLTGFATDSSPLAVSEMARITNVIPNSMDPEVAFVLDPDGPTGVASLQDLFILDLGAFGAITRIPSNAPPFSRLITSGSIHFLPSEPPGLLYASGSVARVGGTIDAIGILSDLTNPIDASAFFHRLDDPTSAFPITNAASGGNRRAVFVWGGN